MIKLLKVTGTVYFTISHSDETVAVGVFFQPSSTTRYVVFESKNTVSARDESVILVGTKGLENRVTICTYGRLSVIRTSVSRIIVINNNNT